MAENDRQIQNMINFINNEAYEKAEEINRDSVETASIERSRFVEAEKKKVRADFEKKQKQIEVQHRVTRSHLVKEMRHLVLAERETLLRTLTTDVDNRLKQLVADPGSYTPLLQNVIVQGIKILRTEKVFLQIMENDRKLVDLAQVAALGTKATGFTVHVEFDEKFLNPDLIGGAIIRSADRELTCDNTLAARKKLILRERIPDIRALLFNELSPELIQAMKAGC